MQNNNNVRNDLGGLGWPCPEQRPLPTCSRRTGDVQYAQNTAQTPDTMFLMYKTSPRHSSIVTVLAFYMQCGSQLWLVSAGRHCCRRPGEGWGDVVHRAAALVRRGWAGARPELRCHRTPLVTVFSSCCSGRSGTLLGKPLTGGTRAATEAPAVGPHTGTGAMGTSPLRGGAQCSAQTSASSSVASTQ